MDHGLTIRPSEIIRAFVLSSPWTLGTRPLPTRQSELIYQRTIKCSAPQFIERVSQYEQGLHPFPTMNL